MIRGWLLGLCLGVGVAAAAAQEPPRALSPAEIVTPAADDAIERGLSFLAARQQPDGSFGGSGYGRNVAVCALAGLAFLSHGDTPGRGPYGDQVERCVDFLLANTQDSGFINVPSSSMHGPMYGHGFATLFLAEVYGMSPRDELREKLSKAVKLIIQTQNNEGGWRYQPQRNDADISVTVCQVMALRAARNGGLHVPVETIEQSIDYVRRSQNADGGFMYMLQGGQSAFPRSAAGVVALNSAGIYDGPEVEKGLTYLMRYIPKGSAIDRESHYFYGQYYAVQAMWTRGGDTWQQWFPAVRDELLLRQRDDGSWFDSICPEYGTSMACIVLQVPNSLLPIFQR